MFDIIDMILSKNIAEKIAQDTVDAITQGPSAYDIAVKNGFEGTEQEWLASLKGERGPSVEWINVT